jgi:hypothetical protein
MAPAFDGQGMGVNGEVGLVVGLEVVKDFDGGFCEDAEVDALVEVLDVVAAVDVEEVDVVDIVTRAGTCTRVIVG